ncbi:MAG: murein hydrolase activator EnvC family protein [Hyphomicrobiaceae bacterium]
MRSNRRHFLGASAAIVVLSVSSAPATHTYAQSTLKRDEASSKLESSRKSLNQAREREKKVRSDLKLAEKERAQINAQLIDTARRVQSGETQLSEIEDRLAELDEQRKLISGSLARQHESIGKLLGALQRMGRNPPPVMMTRRSDALEMVRSAMLLSSVFPELKEKATALSNRLEDLDRVATEIKAQGEQLRQQNKLLAQAEDRLDDLMHTKQTRVVETQKELIEVRRIAQAQAKSVQNLGELIARLDRTVEEQSGLGEYEKELKEGRAPGQDVAILVPEPTPANRPATTQPKVEPPVLAPKQEIQPKRARARPTQPLDGAGASKTRKVARLSPGRLKPSIPFARSKGRLPRPASGRRIFGFGGKTRFGGRSKGVAIETRSRAQITSPNDGWVVYAGPFRSYGQLLIINAGGGYHVLLAGMERINVSIGQFVLAGEPVGKMRAKARKAGSKSQVAAPILYIEFRRKGRPIDPDPWWSGRSAKVQG